MLETLEQLFVEELKDLYSAKSQILQALPMMWNAATSPDLKAGFDRHFEQSKGHASRLEQICLELNVNPHGRHCKAAEGMLADGAKLMHEAACPEVMDAELISAAQRVEHYEMAGYGTCAAYARQLGYINAATLLKETLQEVKETDQHLTALAASHINSAAAYP